MAGEKFKVFVSRINPLCLHKKRKLCVQQKLCSSYHEAVCTFDRVEGFQVASISIAWHCMAWHVQGTRFVFRAESDMNAHAHDVTYVRVGTHLIP